MNSPNRKEKKSGGFALVVTLSLMILLTVIAVGLLSLSSISLRAGSVGRSAETARANAKLALMLAIGELQQQLGPDQRINANASQLSDDGGKTASATAGRRQWLGAYNSWDSTSSTPRPNPTFRGWLVSGLSSDLSKVDFAKSPLSNSEVTFRKGKLADNSDHVAVPKVELRRLPNGLPDGAYAWWISDENSKALVSKMPAGQEDLSNARSYAQAAPAAAYHLNPSLSNISRNDQLLTRVASQGSLDLLAGNPQASDETFLDFTTSSTGILSDVARGGLKRDLSLFLDRPVSKPLMAKLPNQDRIYPDGITWEELWLFHNVWRALEAPPAGLASMTGGTLSNSSILMTKPGSGAASVEAFQNDPFSLYKIPNFIRAQWLLSLWAKVRPGTTPQAYDLYWVTDGILTLWNPFDVPIALHPDSYLSFKFWTIPYTIRLYDGSGLVSTTKFSDAAGSDNTSGHAFTMVFGTAASPYWGRSGTPDPVVLMPGEVLVMSEGPGSGDPIPYAGGNASRSLAMKAGWNLGRGRSFKVDLDRPVPSTSSLRFEASANGEKFTSSSKNLINFTYVYGADKRASGPPDSLFQDLGSRMVNPADGSRATDHEDLFPALSGDLPGIPSMTGIGKYPFLMFSHQAKTEDSATSWTRTHNERCSNANLDKLDATELAASGHEIFVKSLSGSQDSNFPQLSLNQINRGLFGGSYTDLSRGQDTVITLSVPREPPVSLGAFQNAIANGVTTRMGSGALKMGRPTRGPEISHAISNSYALPVIGSDQTETPDYLDHSYHVNRMLWDSWFLSSIVQQQAPHQSPKMTAKEAFSKFVSPSHSRLPNSHMRPWGDPEAAVAELFSTSGEAKGNAYEIASSKLLVEGAFNVNSTSLEAWKAILGSMDEAFIPIADGTNSPSTVKASQISGVPVHSLLTAYGSGSGSDSAAFSRTDVTSAGNPAQWRGYRQLTHDEIDELAKELVSEIRNRGPFLSLADFINRRPSANTQFALRGPLQAALDRTVNSDLFSSSARISASPPGAGIAFPEAAQLPKSLNSPSLVRQADILTAIGPQLTPRSDTFRIRAYGESRDSTGKITASAWCEAVVQRTPEYLDPMDPPEAAENISGRSVPVLTSAVNKRFGRSMVLTSFRWLTPAEMNS